MTKIAAGLLMYRKKEILDPARMTKIEVFLVHPGGPFFKNRDDVWGIPKGLAHEDDKDLLETAIREFQEETGIVIASEAKQSSFVPLGSITYPNGKIVHAWAFEYNLPENFVLKSNPTPQGWPEVDKGEFFPIKIAYKKIYTPQSILLERLEKIAEQHIEISQNLK